MALSVKNIEGNLNIKDLNDRQNYLENLMQVYLGQPKERLEVAKYNNKEIANIQFIEENVYSFKAIIENYLTIQYEKLIPILIQAIKEQQLQIEELKSIVNGITK